MVDTKYFHSYHQPAVGMQTTVMNGVDEQQKNTKNKWWLNRLIE
jgi:allantoicase